jgi:pimeloyl-ACP methyl ester carboxylesterase
MGGYISFSFFRRHPKLVSGLILAATRAGADSDQGRASRDKAVAQTEQLGIRPVIDSMLPILLAPNTYNENPELVQVVVDIVSQTSANGMVSALQGMKDRRDSTQLLGQIEAPALIIHGLDDQIIPMRDSEAMRAGIPNSQLEIIPDAGHLLNLEQPEIFNRIVTSFINQL